MSQSLLNTVANMSVGGLGGTKMAPSTPSTSAETVGVSDDTEVSFTETGEEVIKPGGGATETPSAETPATTTETAKSENEDSGNLFELPAEQKPVAATEETTTTPPPTTQPGKFPAGQRDYSKYDKALLPILKDLPNGKFAQYADQIAEWHGTVAKLAELQKRFDERPSKPQYFYENEHAYALSPDFQRLQTDAQYAQFEVNHFTAQLPRIKRGENWVEITGYDAQGNPQYVERKALENGQPDVDAEVRVMGILNNSRLALQQVQAQAAQYQSQYKQAAQGAQAELKKIDERFFPKMQNIEKDLTPEEQKLYKLALSAFPVYLEGHPLMHMLAKSAIGHQRVSKMYAEAMKEVNRLKGLLNGRKQTEPKPGGSVATVTGGEDDVVKFDEI